MTRFLATILTTVVLAALLVGCGPDQQRAACTYLDWSKSTADVRQDYLDDTLEQLTSAAAAGQRVRVLVGTGAPLAESTVLTEDFSGLTSLEEEPERQQRLTQLLADVEAQTSAVEVGATSPTQGSGISAGVTRLVGDGRCTSVTAYSDGHENADISVYSGDILTPPGRRQLADKLREVDLLPQLKGARVSFPYGGVIPRGTKLSKPRQGALDEWWRTWAREAGGSAQWAR